MPPVRETSDAGVARISQEVQARAAEVTLPDRAEQEKAEQQEAARVEIERLEATRQEAERLEVARQEAARSEAIRQEAARQEVVRVEAARQEAEASRDIATGCCSPGSGTD